MDAWQHTSTALILSTHLCLNGIDAVNNDDNVTNTVMSIFTPRIFGLHEQRRYPFSLLVSLEPHKYDTGCRI